MSTVFPTLTPPLSSVYGLWQQFVRVVCPYPTPTSLRRLSQLVSIDLDTLKQISEIGVLAGGSVVWALNPSIPVESVGDIDVFVRTEKDFNFILNLLMTSGSNPVCKIFAHEHEQWDLTGSPEISVASIKLHGDNYNGESGGGKGNCHNLPLQIILADFETPLDLLKGFDLDYVQCAIHRGDVIQTPTCFQAHKTNTITYFQDGRLRSHRLQKALNKGFEVYWIEDDQDRSNNMVEVPIREVFDSTKKVLRTYLPLNTHDNIPEEGLSMKKLKLIKWVKTKTLSRNPGIKIHVGHFLMGCGSHQIERESIAVRCKIDAVLPPLIDNRPGTAVVVLQKGGLNHLGNNIRKVKANDDVLEDLLALDLTQEHILCLRLYWYVGPNHRGRIVSYLYAKVTRIVPDPHKKIKLVPVDSTVFSIDGPKEEGI